jgi:arylamine N-acetyltransferase
MSGNPLESPTADASVLRQFLEVFRLAPAAEPLARLQQVASAYAGLPYDNLTKIIKDARAGKGTARAGDRAAARRLPGEVLADHVRFGTGGTCFALTATLLHLVRALGWRAEPMLADRRYGPDTHCALMLWIDSRPHVLDPGYLLVRPIPLPATEPVCVPTSFHEVLLSPRDGGSRVDLSTVRQGRATYRLTYKVAAADAGEFLRAWDASFDWDMMHYPVLTRITAGRQIYLRETRLQISGAGRVEHSELAPGTLVARITQEFGIAPSVTAQALELLRRQGDLNGTAAAS